MQVDVAVVGGGTAGLAAVRAAARRGARAVVINAGPWGTTCVRVGCMPSKLLLTAGRAAREVERAGVFGLRPGPLEVDGRAVMARVQAERNRFLASLLDGMDDIAAEDRIDGRARFVGPTTLRVDDRLEVVARAVVIATGSRPTVPEALRPVEDRVLTTRTVFELKDLPRSLAVVGAGAVGIELAVAFARLGVAVSVFDEGESVGGLKDPAVGKAARGLFAAELDLRLGVKIKAQARGEGVAISWTGGGGEGEATFERVLAAAGRPPDLEGLDLRAAGLELDEDGVPVHDRDTLRCGDGAVFIAGDAARELPVLHEASRQGDLAGRNAAGLPRIESETPPTALSIVFTDPDMASVGERLSALGPSAMVGCCDFDDGRARVEDRPGGQVRFYARREDGVLAGAEMVGVGVEHLAHLAAFMVQQRLTAEAALRLPFYHPTYEEQLKDCLRDLAAQGGPAPRG